MKVKINEGLRLAFQIGGKGRMKEYGAGTKEGDVVELPDGQAKRLIDKGKAVKYVVVKKGKAPAAANLPKDILDKVETELARVGEEAAIEVLDKQGINKIDDMNKAAVTKLLTALESLPTFTSEE